MENVRLTGTTNGSGALTVNGVGTVNGLLYAVDVNLSACDATADLTLSTQGADGSLTLLTLTDSQLNSTLYPRGSTCSATGSVGTDQTVYLPLIGIPRAVVAQGGDSKAIQVTLYFIEA